MKVPEIAVELPTHTVAAGEILHRAHAADRPVFFFGPEAGSPPTQRFHAPDGSFKVCFFGLDERAAFVEGVIHRAFRGGPSQKPRCESGRSLPCGS